jgi:1-deoxy-D-xylulose-5-phosphate synthase
MAYPALEAARMLAKEGISAGVLDPRFVKPLDNDLILREAGAVGKVLTVEEGVLQGGFGSSVAELLADEGMGIVSVRRMGIPDRFVEHGTREELLDDLGLTPHGIAGQARDLLEARSVSRLRRIS